MNIGLGLGFDAISVGFSPISLTPIEWQRSDKVTLNGSNVSAWQDQSGNGNDVSQGTGANQPVYNTTDATFNNLPTLAWGGGGKVLLSAAGLTIPQPNTIYVVASITAASGEVIDGGVTRQTFGKSAGVWQIYAGGSVITGGTADNNVHVFCGTFSATSSLYIDNSTTAVCSGAAGTNNLVQTSIAGTFSPNTGAIAELIICSGIHNQPTRSQVFKYAASRYNIVAS